MASMHVSSGAHDASVAREMPRIAPRRPAWWVALGWLSLAPVLWVLVALVSSARGGLVLAHGRARPIAWPDVFTGALYEFSWWMVLGPVVVLMVWRLARWRAPGPLRVVVHAGAGAAVCLLYFALRSRIHLPGDTFRIAPDVRGLRSILPPTIGMYTLIAAAAGLAFALRQARAREHEAAALALHASRLETQLLEAQLGVLRAQLHPHFLFNALHAISTLVDWRPKEARRMLVQLSELLRMALELSETREIPLVRELEWLEHYVELQEVRFGDRLQIDVRVAPDALGALVPPLLLQPLVENAIKHGVEPRPAGGHVEVLAERDGRWLRVRVRDDGAGPSASAASGGSGVGLRNTRARLAALYGDEQQVVLRAAEVGAELLVELPFREAKMARASEQAG